MAVTLLVVVVVVMVMVMVMVMVVVVVVVVLVVVVVAGRLVVTLKDNRRNRGIGASKYAHVQWHRWPKYIAPL